jgi:hypothetical protein
LASAVPFHSTTEGTSHYNVFQEAGGHGCPGKGVRVMDDPYEQFMDNPYEQWISLLKIEGEKSLFVCCEFGIKCKKSYVLRYNIYCIFLQMNSIGYRTKAVDMVKMCLLLIGRECLCL